MRDAVCGLLDWAVGSEEWLSFIEGPEPGDVERLESHLGLVRLDQIIPHHFAWLIEHPGLSAISIYDLPSEQRSHFQYEPSIGSYRGLPSAYYLLDVDPVLIGFLVDGSAVS